MGMQPFKARFLWIPLLLVLVAWAGLYWMPRLLTPPKTREVPPSRTATPADGDFLERLLQDPASLIGPNGKGAASITEADANTYLARYLAGAGEGPSPVQDLRVAFSPRRLGLNGHVSLGPEAPFPLAGRQVDASLVFEPSIEAGQVRLRLLEAAAGRIALPPTLALRLFEVIGASPLLAIDAEAGTVIIDADGALALNGYPLRLADLEVLQGELRLGFARP